MQNKLIARTFARAFCNNISESSEKQDILAQYKCLVDCVEKQQDFESFLVTPKISIVEKKNFVEKLFRGKFHDMLVNFLLVLASKGHLSEVCAIYEEVENLEKLEGDKVKVRITTAIKLNDEVTSNISTSIGKKLNATAILEEKVDPGILGGIIIQVEDTMVNGSLKRHLEKIGNCILERSRTYGI